ncbi:ThiF family adenylyltransferase [Chitinophaga pendula]|uniref:ThiF family adenylyltransferase n=1 Tax=Chitinophaga TaxID=79328 RepID=UPI000BAE77E7|nr:MULTISPECIES: ThiF family adenylyltransferase [Chitinophaga]ASZ10925.1 hypothetical protein CK934_08025 [Chitinophaga sp. MD30]UCJ06087.1 ThiF family adenylyltransferase [Chitinophaga pendula]
MKILNDASQRTLQQQHLYQPLFFDLQQAADEEGLAALLQSKPYIGVYDQIDRQLQELMRMYHISERLEGDALEERIGQHLGGVPRHVYGLWVYYPWAERLVHILGREEFIALRTNRNMYKITPAELAVLSTKKVAVIGLSVGQSAAISMVQERICSEIRIADFDLLDLSNMNRIRTGVHHLGLPKTVLTAREIAEIDPFVTVRCYPAGITEENIDVFLTEGGAVDLLVEECDSLDIKLLSRIRARAFGIPVIMDTSDRGMMDVERFDLEPGRPIFHGTVPELSSAAVRAMNPQERFGLAAAIADATHISTRLRDSLPEIGKTIGTWPQLASEVILGGAVATFVGREICLGHAMPSGRYYVDIAQIFAAK